MFDSCEEEKFSASIEAKVRSLESSFEFSTIVVCVPKERSSSSPGRDINSEIAADVEELLPDVEVDEEFGIDKVFAF